MIDLKLNSAVTKLKNEVDYLLSLTKMDVSLNKIDEQAANVDYHEKIVQGIIRNMYDNIQTRSV